MCYLSVRKTKRITNRANRKNKQKVFGAAIVKMRFKLFVVCALACGFMAYVLANENISAEVEDQIINSPVANKASKKAQAVEFVEIVEPLPPAAAAPAVPAPVAPAVKKVDKVVAAKPAATPSAAPAVKAKVASSPVAFSAASSRGTDDILTVAGLKPQAKSGALVMPFDYLGELYDLDSTGYNWGKCNGLPIVADSVHNYSYAVLNVQLSYQQAAFGSDA